MKKRIILASVIFIGLVGAFFLYFLISLFWLDPIGELLDKPKYQKDADLLLSYARTVGYDEKVNHVNYFRQRGTGIESKHDYTTIVFATPDPVDVFATKLNLLHVSLQGQYADDPAFDFLTRVNEDSRNPIVTTTTFQPNDSVWLERDYAPRVEWWNLSTSEKKNLTVFHATLPQGSYWMVKDEKIEGNLVVMLMGR